MDVSTLKAQIVQNKIDSYYIFTGPEWYVQNVYINQIAKTLGIEVVRVDDIASVYTKIQSRSFLVQSSCFVVRDDPDLLSNEKLQKQIDDGILGNNILIHLVTAVDKRTKFYKRYKDAIVEFEPLAPEILKKYIKRILPNFTDKNCSKLIDLCEYDYGRILLELNKITFYDEVQALGHMSLGSENRAFEVLLSTGAIYTPPKDAIFDLVDAILDRKINESFNLLQQSYDSGEATMVMLSVLYNNAKAVLQVQSCRGGDVAKITGLTGWQIMNAKKHLGKYSLQELINLLKYICSCERGIKTGAIDENIVMERLLVDVL